jgi:hypothetical protein
MSYDAIKSIVVLLALLVATGIFLRYVWQLLWVNLRRGQPSGPFRNWGERIKGLIVFVGAQWRLFRFRLPGAAHFFIFWGFLLLSLTILQAIVRLRCDPIRPRSALIGTWGCQHSSRFLCPVRYRHFIWTIPATGVS